jgi:glycosyltransferase involved in cell wall biosynthesis
VRVAFDAQLLGKTNTGVGKYIEYLLAALDSPGLGPRHEIHVFLNGHDPAGVRWHALTRKEVRWAGSSRLLRIAWEQCVFPLAIRGGYELVHAPAYVGPVLGRVPLVVTVHDLFALTHPDLCSRANTLHYRLLLPATVTRSAHVIVPSQWVRQQVLQHFGLTPGRVSVVPEGINERLWSAPGPGLMDSLARCWGLRGRTLLFVGNIEPKKNLVALLQVFDRLRASHRDLRLVICGGLRWRSRRFLQTLRSLRCRSDVVLTGYLPDEHVHALYHLAELFVFPSLTEGFGVPPLEAMASGTPVVASNGGALGEVLGSAALLVDPGQPRDLEQAILRVMSSRDLREDLRGRGLTHSRQFDWRRAAGETLAVYETAARSARKQP